MLYPNTAVTHPTASSSHACKLVLSLYLHLLILPQGRCDDLSCSPRLIGRDETGDGNPKQPHGSFPINQSGKQCTEDGQHLLRQLEALLTAAGPGHQLERAPAHLERQRLAGDPQFGRSECPVRAVSPPSPSLPQKTSRWARLRGKLVPRPGK